MNNGLDVQIIKENYQQMPDIDLIRLATKEFAGLTEEAQQVLEQEIKRRNLDLNSIRKIDEELQEKQVLTKRSLEFALLFTFLFGPFGVLYVSVTYGIILIVLGVIGFAFLNYIGLLIVWIVSIGVAFQAKSNSKSSNSVTIQPTNDRESLLNQLTQLHSLKEKEVITEDVYEQEKQKILKTLDTTR